MTSSSQALLCDTCNESDQSKEAIGLCKECMEIYCPECADRHKALRATKAHTLVIIHTANKDGGQPDCDPCTEMGKGKKPAQYLCAECRELYCDLCKQHHLKLKATRSHYIHELYPLQNTASTLPQQPIQTENVAGLSSSFETCTLSSVGESSVQTSSRDDETSSQTDCVFTSSDFEGFDALPSQEQLGAQFPVFQSRFKGQGKRKWSLSKDDMDRLSARVVSVFPCKTDDDEIECEINGIICLADGRLIVLDMNNKKLKMFNKDFEIICTEATELPGLSMAKVTEAEIAVASTAQTVDFYNVSKNEFILLKEKSFKIEAHGYGISCNKNVFAIICDIYEKDRDGFIKICSDAGKELHRITSFKYKPGHILSLDTELDRIYVSSKDQSKFMCMSVQGGLQWEMDFYGKDVIELFNYLLVTEYNGGLVLCSKDGRFRRTLIDDTIGNHLEYIAINSKTQQVFVTRFHDNDVIVVQLLYRKSKNCVIS